MEQKIYQKQFSIGEIFSESWKRFVESFREIFIIIAIVYIPINTILYFIPIGESFEGLYFYIRVVQILEVFIGVFATMTIAYIVKGKIDSHEMNLKKSFQKSLSKWLSLFVTNFMIGVFLLGLILLLIVPGIIFGVYWVFVPLVVILKNKNLKNALNYSKRIVKGRWWIVLGYSSLFFGLSLIIILLGAFLFGIFEGILSIFNFENIIIDVIDNTILDLVDSFFTVISVVFFINFDATKVKFKEENKKEEIQVQNS